MHLLNCGRAARAAAVATVVGCVLAPAAMAKPSRPNDFGVRVVRFAPGTTPVAMRQAVQQAGGRVVTDLSKIGAMAVA